MLVHSGPTVKRTGPFLLPFVMFIITLVILALATFLYFTITAEAASGRADLSGIWIFNPAESVWQFVRLTYGALAQPLPNAMSAASSRK